MIDFSKPSPVVEGIVKAIQPEKELRVGKHLNTSGFYAQIISFPDDTEIYWGDASHGHTVKEALQNAFARYTNQEETLYQVGDFHA